MARLKLGTPFQLTEDFDFIPEKTKIILRIFAYGWAREATLDERDIIRLRNSLNTWLRWDEARRVASEELGIPPF